MKKSFVIASYLVKLNEYKQILAFSKDGLSQLALHAYTAANRTCMDVSYTSLFVHTLGRVMWWISSLVPFFTAMARQRTRRLVFGFSAVSELAATARATARFPYYALNYTTSLATVVVVAVATASRRSPTKHP